MAWRELSWLLIGWQGRPPMGLVVEISPGHTQHLLHDFFCRPDISHSTTAKLIITFSTTRHRAATCCPTNNCYMTCLLPIISRISLLNILINEKWFLSYGLLNVLNDLILYYVQVSVKTSNLITCNVALSKETVSPTSNWGSDVVGPEGVSTVRLQLWWVSGLHSVYTRRYSNYSRYGDGSRWLLHVIPPAVRPFPVRLRQHGSRYFKRGGGVNYSPLSGK